MKHCIVFVWLVSCLYALDILPKQLTMHPGTKLQFAIFHEENGAIFTPHNLKWQVSDGSISNDGSYTAPHKTGKYFIKVTHNNLVADAVVYVKLPQDNYVTKLTIVPPQEKIYAGQVVEMRALGYDQKNNIINFVPSWRVRGAGEISENGKLKALASGKVEVMVKDMNSPAFTMETFTVHANNIKRIDVSPKKVNLTFGQKMRFFAVAYDGNNNEVSFEPKWSVSGHGGIQKNGEYTAGSYIGNAKVTALDPISGIKSEAEVTISQTASASQGSIEIGVFLQHNNVLKIAYQVFGDNIHRTSLFAIQKDNTLKLLDSCTCSNGANITFEKQYPYEALGFEIQIYDNYNRMQGSVRRNFNQ